jgi:hypothetical protein
MTPLPARLGRYRRFGPLPADTALRCRLRARPLAGGHLLDTDIVLTDADGRVVAAMEHMEFSCSRALNRLGPVEAGA